MCDIFVNLKRFDVPRRLGGVCPQDDSVQWIEFVITATLAMGCQGVFREDVALGGNFGAFTTNRPAAAMKNLGCDWATPAGRRLRRCAPRR
ncbi:MAG: hypothetical protein PVH64_12410 [Bacillota bacterium]|jgi:triosephosphate isomerase